MSIKLRRTKKSRYLYVEGRDWEGVEYRLSTGQTEEGPALLRARQIQLERSVPRTKPYSLLKAFSALQDYKKVGKKSDAELEIVTTKSERVMEYFGPERDSNTLTHAELIGYVERRRLCEIGTTIDGETKFVSDSTIRKELDKLFEALRLAKTDGKFVGDVDKLARSRRVLVRSRPRTRTLTEDEFVLLYWELPRNRQDYLFSWVMLGARYGELERIVPASIDHDNRRVWIVGHKGDPEWRERWVPIGEEMYRLLCRRADRVKAGEPLFPAWENSNANTMLKRYCALLEIAPLSINDLRRTFITWHGMYGTSEADMKKLVGHSPASKMVERAYRQLPADAGRPAIERLRFGLTPNDAIDVGDGVNVVPIRPHVATQTVEQLADVKQRRDHREKLLDWQSLSREALAKLVWAKPADIIAHDYGISGTAVAARCKRLGIDKPGNGYWQKLEARVGKKTW
jgi:integrase